MNKSLLKLITSPASLFLFLALSLNGWGQSAISYETFGILNSEPGYLEAIDLESTVTFINLSDKGASITDNDKSASQNERLRIYPNPSDGLFTLEINKTESIKVSVEILDITGKLVYRNDFPVMGTLKESIDLQNLNKGMYFLRVKEGEKISTVKVILR